MLIILHLYISVDHVCMYSTRTLLLRTLGCHTVFSADMYDLKILLFATFFRFFWLVVVPLVTFLGFILLLVVLLYQHIGAGDMRAEEEKKKYNPMSL